MKNLLNACLLSCLFVFCLVTLGFAQETTGTSIVGKWKTIDDKTNEPKSIVQIYERDGKYYGKIIELFIKEGKDPDPVCKDCPDDDPRKNQPIKGMEIIKDLVLDDGVYSGGTILDPKKGEGKIYTCKLWIEDGVLQVRGYIMFFFRTQTWFRVE
ncbi:MAG: DUF2147 domain-containing protein [Desulfobacula sp.]|nr:DUF2147 domain-containing protein [Desulfobacula sp.]